MIDGQLYVLYKRFKRASEVETNRNNAYAIEKFISKMVYDSFAKMMDAQIGFTIDFKASCDAVVRYIMDVNNAEDMEDYGRVMMSILYILNALPDEGVRVDEQLIFERKLYYESEFCSNILETILKLVNINYKWHLFFLVLCSLERGDNSDDLESFISYYRGVVLSNRSFAMLEQEEVADAREIRFDFLNAVSEVFKERQNIDYLCAVGIKTIHRALNYVIPMVVEECKKGKSWESIKGAYLNVFKGKLQL